MKTYIFIHGGESFQNHEEYLKWIETTLIEWNLDPFVIKTEKKKWKTEIATKLIENGATVYMPNFPNPQNAKYSEWKLFFDTWITKISLASEIILVGNSLGGCFLLKYFSENPKPLPISEVHLLASCIEAGDFTPPDNYNSLQELGNKVHIWHSEDDMVVPFSIGKELSMFLPKAETHFFSIEKGYGHFHGIENIPEFENTLFNK